MAEPNVNSDILSEKYIQVQQSQGGGYLTYQNPNLGFEIKYPGNSEVRPFLSGV
jgi:hypothetical protein